MRMKTENTMKTISESTKEKVPSKSGGSIMDDSSLGPDDYCNRCGKRLQGLFEIVNGEKLCEHCAKVARDPTSRKPKKKVPQGVV